MANIDSECTDLLHKVQDKYGLWSRQADKAFLLFSVGNKDRLKKLLEEGL